MEVRRTKHVFASDFHLGIDVKRSSKERELLIVDWLLSMKDEMKVLYLVGDIFDYWYEYKRTIPRGFSDFLACLKQLRNEGIEIHLFTGNHDMWMFDYFSIEYGMTVHKKGIRVNLNGKSFYVAHGDGLGPGDYTYKFIKSIFSNKVCQWFFSLIHPTIALEIMRKISQRDAKKYVRRDQLDVSKEWLIQFAEKEIKEDRVDDFYIFGHRHLVYDHRLENGSRVINLGDWISYFSYAVWDGKDLQLKHFIAPDKPAVS